MFQDVYIIGASGKVGRTLVRQIYEKGDIDDDRHDNPTRVVGLASRTHTIYSPHGLSREQAEAFSGRKYKSAKRYSKLIDLLEFAKVGIRNDHSKLVFIDVTALADEMRVFHLYVIENTPYSIVTANKNPISLYDYKTFRRLTHDTRRYGYRCSVMAGADAIPIIQDTRDLNERVLTIEGCFSGTLNFILSGLEKGRKFSAMLKEAHRRKYTEPHPGDDLSGLDVARKLVVLARTAGFPVNIDDIPRESFIPASYLEEPDKKRFMGEVAPKLDDWFKRKMDEIKARGETLRYVARMDATQIPTAYQVSTLGVPSESRLGTLEGTLNALIIKTDAPPEHQPDPLVKPGAGIEITARNIRRDLIHLLPERNSV